MLWAGAVLSWYMYNVYDLHVCEVNLYVFYCFMIFMPPQTKSGGGIMRCTCPSVRLSVSPSVLPSVPRIGFRTITSKILDIFDM